MGVWVSSISGIRVCVIGRGIRVCVVGKRSMSVGGGNSGNRGSGVGGGNDWGSNGGNWGSDGGGVRGSGVAETVVTETGVSETVVTETGVTETGVSEGVQTVVGVGSGVVERRVSLGLGLGLGLSIGGSLAEVTSGVVWVTVTVSSGVTVVSSVWRVCGISTISVTKTRISPVLSRCICVGLRLSHDGGNSESYDEKELHDE
jgi:hypothetical protein